MSLTAEERIAATRACSIHKPEHHTRICEQCAMAALHAHANAALERASSRIKSYRVIAGERDDIRETVETVRDQFAAAILALREEK